MSYKKSTKYVLLASVAILMVLAIVIVSGRINPDPPCISQNGDSASSSFPLIGAPPRIVSTRLGTVSVTTLLECLHGAWALASLPDDKFLLTTKPGDVQVYDALTNELRDVRGMKSVILNHRGHLFDVYPHPEFPTNHWVYFSYAVENKKGLALEVARAQFRKNKLTKWQTLFTGSPRLKKNKHFGGGLAVHGGYLYIALGDHFNRPSVQELSTHVGKIVRLHDDGRTPGDNPFVAVENAQPEIYAIGLRNPQNMAVDRFGNIWAVEHGPLAGDELNRIQSGKNYGWPLVSIGTEYDGKPLAPDYKGGVEMTAPVHDFEISVAPSGLAFYDHDLIPFWKDSLFVTTLVGTRLERLVMQDNEVVQEEQLFSMLKTRLRDIQVSSSGRIYLVTEDGRIIKVDAAPE